MLAKAGDKLQRMEASYNMYCTVWTQMSGMSQTVSDYIKQVWIWYGSWAGQEQKYD